MTFLVENVNLWVRFLKFFGFSMQCGRLYLIFHHDFHHTFLHPVSNHHFTMVSWWYPLLASFHLAASRKYTGILHLYDSASPSDHLFAPLARMVADIQRTRLHLQPGGVPDLFPGLLWPDTPALRPCQLFEVYYWLLSTYAALRWDFKVFSVSRTDQRYTISRGMAVFCVNIVF